MKTSVTFNSFLRKKLFLKTILILLIFSIFGCTTKNIKYVGRKTRTTTMTSTILTGKKLSYKTQQYLASNALAAEFKEDPEKVIKMLAEYIEKPNDLIITDTVGVRLSLYVLMELCVHQAAYGSKKDALKYWMSTCFYSYKYIFDKSVDPPIDKYYTMLGLVMALHFYNISLSGITESLINKTDLWESMPVFKTVMGDIKFTPLKSDLLWSPKLFKKFVNALDYLPNNFLAHSFSTGIGVPLIGVKNENSKYREEHEFTLLNQSYPFIFVLKFDAFNFKKGYINAEPELLEAFEDEYVELNDKKVPLYKDYSILIGKTLDSKDPIKGIQYMFDPGKMGDLQELYLMTPYNPDKIPVVLIHGLMSEPRTWSDTLNLLFSHREIRTNYQFLFYSYPTGMSAIFNAAKFREDLLKFKEKYDPDNTNSKMNSMILVGHSMGGLLARLVVQDSKGNYLVNNLLHENIEQTSLTEDQKKLLERIYVFKALPFVKSVILIGTPHRGAEMANYFFAKIGSLLVALPSSMTHEALGILQGLESTQLSEDMDTIGLVNGIDDLSPDKGMKKYTVDLPFGKNVTLYSIIGDKDEAGKKGGTDGIVAYESSHLDNVKSEVIIKSGHDEIKKSSCIKEITKILFENLEEYNKLHPDSKPKIKLKE